ncbi:MAG: hypothetical protein IKH18_10125 [Clostridia bacterium]|nr:hypothetical protein [Clostridia bacterium]
MYSFYVVTDQEWSDDEYNAWFQSLSSASTNQIAFDADWESDGAFYGINQNAQKYTVNRIFDEDKFRVARTGHGWAAERGNNLIDNIKGFFQGYRSQVIGDNNVKNGADRLVEYADGTRLYIQSKYYSTAARGIAACFEDGQFKYVDYENNPMAIEVPSDQYEAALSYMKNRIANGELENAGVKRTEIERASEIVKKGNLSYQQARHIAKAGNVESILYDSAHACVSSVTFMGISAAVDFAVNLWNGESFETAIKESVFQGLKTGGTTFIISVFSSQLAKTGLNSALVPAGKVISHALGPKMSAAIINAFRPAGSAIYGAAAMKSVAKLLRGNIITSAVSFVVLSAEDVADIIQGKISWKQLAKNVSATAAGLAGGMVGYLGGAALGTAIFPGIGTIAGTAISLITATALGWGASEGAKALGDLIADDDAEEMIRIIETEFAGIAEEYFLNEEELNKSVENLQKILSASMLKQMFQYHDHEAFARQLIEMAIDPVVAEREYIELPSEDEYSEYLTKILDAVYEDMTGETVTE